MQDVKRAFQLSPLALAIAAGLNVLPAQADTLQQDTLTVWAAEVTSSSEWLGEDSISHKQPDHMSDLLRDIPGVDVGGTHSVTQRINIRGLGETELDIRLDGASQNANMFHHIGSLTLNADIIKSADIQVGANSVVNDGIGGAVHFETKNANDLLRPGQTIGARLHTSYGSNSYQQGSATVYGKPSDSTDLLLYGFQINRDNFEDGEGNDTFGSDGEVQNGLIKLGWEPSQEQRFQLSYDRYADEGDYNPRPDMGGGANTTLSADQLIPTEYDRSTLALNHELDKGDALFVTTSLYRSETELFRDESVVTGRWPGNRLSKNTATNINTGLLVKAQSIIQTGDIEHELTYGVDINRQDSNSQYGSSMSMSEELTKKALFVEDRIQLTPAWSLTPGVRYNHVQRDAETGSDSFNDLTWALATDYAVNDNLTLFASTRELFKAPELLETFIAYQATSELVAGTHEESGLNTELGARYQMDMGAHRFTGGLTLFRTDIDDRITESYNAGRGGYDIFNGRDVRLEGFELSGTYRYQDFSGKLGYARTEATYRDDGSVMLDVNGRSADLGDSLSLSLNYDLPSWNAELGWSSIWVMEEDAVEAGSDVKEAYDVHSLFAQWAPAQADGLTLTFGIDNLFDEQYVSHASRTGSARGARLDDYEPGRNVKVSVAYQF